VDKRVEERNRCQSSVPHITSIASFSCSADSLMYPNSVNPFLCCFVYCLILSPLLSSCHVLQGGSQFFSLAGDSSRGVMAVVTVFTGSPELYLSCHRMNASAGVAHTIFAFSPLFFLMFDYLPPIQSSYHTSAHSNTPCPTPHDPIHTISCQRNLCETVKH
jgi:hypothetical protein